MPFSMVRSQSRCHSRDFQLRHAAATSSPTSTTETFYIEATVIAEGKFWTGFAESMRLQGHSHFGTRAGRRTAREGVAESTG